VYKKWHQIPKQVHLKAPKKPTINSWHCIIYARQWFFLLWRPIQVSNLWLKENSMAAKALSIVAKFIEW